jgi:hypothetical protein
MVFELQETSAAADYGNSRKFTLIVVSISMGSPFSSVGV